MHQISLFEVFNEPEFFSDDSEEPEVSEIIAPSHTRKTKTLREENLKGLPVRVYEHELKKEELNRLFPNGYKEIKPVVYKRLSIIPQTFLIDEHRIHQYTSKDNDGRIIKAKRSPDLFRNSIATASLVAAIINGSYMWVYCTGESEKHPVILYDYRSTRKADHPKEFLRNSKEPLPHRVWRWSPSCSTWTGFAINPKIKTGKITVSVRSRHPSLHPRAEELGQRRFHPRSRSQRRHVQPGRDCKSKRTPGLRISGICADRACSTPG